MFNKLEELKKPKTMKAQVDVLWEVCTNHIPTRLKWLDVKVNFILAFTGLVLALVAISIFGG